MKLQNLRKYYMLYLQTDNMNENNDNYDKHRRAKHFAIGGGGH